MPALGMSLIGGMRDMGAVEAMRGGFLTVEGTRGAAGVFVKNDAIFCSPLPAFFFFALLARSFLHWALL